MPQENIRHVSTAQLAQYLGISTVAVFKRIQKGRIKAVKIGRSYAIPESYVQEHFPGFKFAIIEKGDYLSVMEAARILGISRVTVFNRIKDGTIAAKRVGRHYVILKEVINKQTQEESQLAAASHNEYFSVPQYAELLGISRIAVFRKIQKGQISAQKMGRSFVIGPSIGPNLTAMNQQVLGKYISLPQLALRLGISRVAVFKKVRKGLIPAIRVGRRYMVQEDFVKRLISG